MRTGDQAAREATMTLETKPERLDGPGQITIEGGCETFGKTEIRFLPEGDSVSIEFENVDGHDHYFGDLPPGVVRLVIGPQELAGFIGGLRARLAAPGGEPPHSTAARTIRIELEAQGGALTADLVEWSSPSVEGVDKLLHELAAEARRRQI
jgi:hypothetical protein